MTPTPEIEFDQESFNDFMAEARELMDKLQPVILDFEKNPRRQATIDEAFRILHSLKGMAGFFAITGMKNVAHRLEDLLGEVKAGRKIVGAEVIDALMKGAEIIGRILGGLSFPPTAMPLTAEEEAFLELLEKMKRSLPTLDERIRELLLFGRDFLAELGADERLAAHTGLAELSERLAAVEEALPEAAPEAEEKHFFTGEENYRGVPVGPSLLVMETICRSITDKKTPCADETTARVFADRVAEIHDLALKAGVNELVEPIGKIREQFEMFQSTIGFEEILAGVLLQHLEEIHRLISAATPAAAAPAATAPADEAKAAKTFRVDEAKVDDFMNYVAELIITGERFGYLEGRLAEERVQRDLTAEFRTTTVAFGELSEKLQKSLLDIRKLPVNSILKKYQAMVRNMARQLEKKIEFKISGGEYRTDKSLIEILEVPLTHIIRNSVDHGIETVAKRLAAGKPETGTLSVKVAADESRMTITIEDDGGGLNLERIKAKARAQGLFAEEELAAMTDQQVANIIFLPGFSTAEAVTDLSGRGVGMDAVLTTVRGAGGEVDVTSTPGQGTRTVISLPQSQTVMVIEGLIVETAGNQFFITLDRLAETVSYDLENVSTVHGRGELVNLRGSVFPLFRLDRLLQLPRSQNALEHKVLLVRDGNQRFGLVVDRIREQTKVVVRKMDSLFGDVNYASGCGVMGDGRLCLVLEPAGLAELARQGTAVN